MIFRRFGYYFAMPPNKLFSSSSFFTEFLFVMLLRTSKEIRQCNILIYPLEAVIPINSTSPMNGFVRENFFFYRFYDQYQNVEVTIFSSRCFGNPSYNFIYHSPCFSFKSQKYLYLSGSSFLIKVSNLRI